MKNLKVSFTTIPNDAILDKRLDTYEFRVLCYLCKLSNEENICFPSYSTIAANMNIRRSKTTNIINRLIDLGYIEKENLRDNMGDLEVVLTMLAESTTTELSKTTNPQNFQENVEVAKKGGNIAGDTRKAIEESTGKPVITSKNAAELNAVVTNLIEGIAEDAADEE